MVIDNGWPRRGVRYHVAVFSVLLALLAAAIFFFDHLSWLVIITGGLFGGFVVDALVDWLKYRREKAGPDPG